MLKKDGVARMVLLIQTLNIFHQTFGQEKNQNAYLLVRFKFYTRFASEIESDPVGDYTRARMALQELEIDPATAKPLVSKSLKEKIKL